MKVKKYQAPLSLKPTQFSVGLLEIEFKLEALRKMSSRKLTKIIKNTPVPVFITPWKEICILDHHHFVFACWHADIKKVRIKIIKDFSNSKLTYNRFWKKMAKKNFAYLYDQFGKGPQNPLYLPLDVRGMADDPYRSLAWVARQEGGYNNSPETYAEFLWADLFRQKKLLHTNGRPGFKKAVEKAVKLAKSPAAKSLPGYIKRRK